jgi:mRNA interferase MazF
MPDRGEIWLAELNAPHGTESGETRIPLTTKLVNDAEPLRIRVSAAGRLARNSDLLMDQFRAIDNRRPVRGPLLRLPASLMKRVAAALLELVGP